MEDNVTENGAHHPAYIHGHRLLYDCTADMISAGGGRAVSCRIRMPGPGLCLGRDVMERGLTVRLEPQVRYNSITKQFFCIPMLPISCASILYRACGRTAE